LPETRQVWYKNNEQPGCGFARTPVLRPQRCSLGAPIWLPARPFLYEVFRAVSPACYRGFRSSIFILSIAIPQKSNFSVGNLRTILRAAVNCASHTVVSCAPCEAYQAVIHVKSPMFMRVLLVLPALYLDVSSQTMRKPPSFPVSSRYVRRRPTT
jgi:hypothetical protein